MWRVYKRDINFLLLCISVVVSQLSYGSMDTERMPQTGAAQSWSAVDSPSEAYEPLKCYYIRCSGEGCLYPFIRNITDKSAFTCIGMPSELCYIDVESGPSGVSVTAGCGIICGPAVNTSAPLVLGNTTLPPGEETKKTTLFFEPKRRRRRNVNPRRKCCYSNYCNHDSPCGQLVCSAGFYTVANILLYIFLAVSLNKV